MKKLSNILLQVLPLLILSSCFASTDFNSEAERAASLRKQGKFEAAISAYEEHIQDRLSNPNRPESENPYFYYIYIFDIYLEQNKDKEAYESLIYAKEHGIERSLVISRARELGKWYETHGQLDRAIEVLSEFRKLDPLLIDLDIDHIHKESIEKENVE